MKEVILKIPKGLFNKMLDDLKRPHAFALERIGFISTKHKKLSNGSVIIFGVDYFSVDDENYIDDDEVGARINSTAIRIAMQMVLDSGNGCFHVHFHVLSFGIPEFSDIDFVDNPEIVKSFTYVNRSQVHGMLVLGNNASNAMVKIPGDETELTTVSKIVVVGYPMNFSFLKNQNFEFDKDRFDRQSFLGEGSQFQFSNVRIGIVGVGGGGSHIVQQLAHLGIHNYNIFEFDETDKSNLNRLIGAELQDAKESIEKTVIAERMIRRLMPNANIKVYGKWQENPDKVHECDIVIGGVDSFVGRRDLEAECRRYLIPVVDIGMDVHDEYEEEAPSMAGQIICSMPGYPCMKCMGFINERNLAKEAAKYGNAGGKPQVVWSNGVLASSAVGVVVDLITGWTKQEDRLVYLAYDGNQGTVESHLRLSYLKNQTCEHYAIENVGPPCFKRL